MHDFVFFKVISDYGFSPSILCGFVMLLAEYARTEFTSILDDSPTPIQPCPLRYRQYLVSCFVRIYVITEVLNEIVP